MLMRVHNNEKQNSYELLLLMLNIFVIVQGVVAIFVFIMLFLIYFQVTAVKHVFCLETLLKLEHLYV